MRKQNVECGFTLIELLTTIVIIGVLASLSFSGFIVYRASAAYAVASVTLRNMRNAVESSLSDEQHLPPATGLVSQTTQGSVTNVRGKILLAGLQVPKNTKIQYSYDPTCVLPTCIETTLETRHLSGREFPRYVRFGDGSEILLENISGAGW